MLIEQQLLQPPVVLWRQALASVEVVVVVVGVAVETQRFGFAESGLLALKCLPLEELIAVEPSRQKVNFRLNNALTAPVDQYLYDVGHGRCCGQLDGKMYGLIDSLAVSGRNGHLNRYGLLHRKLKYLRLCWSNLNFKIRKCTKLIIY